MNFRNYIFKHIIPFIGLPFCSPKTLPVIYYHDIVDPGMGYLLMRTDVDNFYEQMKFLASNDYQTILFSELSADMKKNPKDKRILITFDDGFASNYYKAFPIIKELKIKINIFLTYNFINSDNYLSSDQIQEMQESGLVEFGYHTNTHCDCRLITDNDMFEKEIVEGLKSTEIIVKKKITEFCYPYGYYNKDIIQMISKHNLFKHQFLSNYIKPLPIGDCVVCGRIGIDNNWDIDTFEKTIKGKYRIMHYYSKIRVGVPRVK